MKVTERITWLAVVQSNFYLILYMVEISISSGFFVTDIWVCWLFCPLGSMQSFTVIVSWFVFIVMLGDFLCTRARRAGTNGYVSKFRLQIALSKIPDFWAVGFWEKLAFLWLIELLVHSSDTEFIHDAIFYWVISKAVCITMTYYILPNSSGAAVMFCLY